MIKIPHRILHCVCLLILITAVFWADSSPVYSQGGLSPTPVDYKLPYPGLLPDHPLYPLKRLRDRILYLFSPNLVKKIELSLLFADKKIGMAGNLNEKGRVDLALDFILESQSDLLNAASRLPELSKNNLLPAGLSDKIELAAKKHRELMAQISQTLQDGNQTDRLEKALSLNNQAVLVIESVKD